MSKRQSSFTVPSQQVARNIDNSTFDIIKIVKDNIDNVVLAGNGITGINIVADSIVDVQSLATDINILNSLYADKLTLDSLFTDKSTLDSLFADKATLDSLFADKATLDSLFSDKLTLDSLYADKSILDRVFTSISNIDRVFASVGNLDIVFGSITSVDTVANNISSVNTASTNIASINTAANSIADINTFIDTYYNTLAIAPTIVTHPTLTQGDLYYDSALNELRVYDGVVWKSAGSTVNGTSVRQTFTATAGQTIFTVSGGYDANFADVYLNGTKLVNIIDVDVTSGTNVVLAVGATAGDIVDVIAYGAFNVANTVDLSTAQTVSGVKTFTSSPIIPNAVNVNEPLSKGQLLTEMKAIDGADSGLDADTVDGVQGALLGVGGAGYAWYNVTASRTSGVTYTNISGKPIQVSISNNNGAACTYSIYVSGVLISRTNESAATGVVHRGYFIVPNGATYQVAISAGGFANLIWAELR